MAHSTIYETASQQETVSTSALGKAAYAEEQENFSRLYSALINERDIPPLKDFGKFSELAEMATQLYEARKQGPESVLAIIKSWTNRKHPTPEIRKALTSIAGASTTPKTEKLAQKVEITRDERLVPPLPEELLVTPEMTRGLCPLKDEYVAYSRIKSPEGYEEFHHSCFWAMASTIAARRVAIDLESKQHTALNVMLAARSTLYAKTETAEVERHVLKDAELDWLLGLTRTTPQKLLYDMSGPVPENYGELSNDEQKQLRMRVAMAAQRGWHYNEFGKLLKAMMQPSGPMSDFIGVLLQISDGTDLPGGTIGRGNEMVTSPYIAITGTLTPASIKAVASKHAELWSDGFFARIVWSCPPPGGYKDAPFKSGFTKVPKSLSNALKSWHTRLGVPELDIEPITDDKGEGTGRYRKVWVSETFPEKLYRLSEDAYKGWASYRSELKRLITKLPTHDLDASYGRLNMMALRVAALAASLEDTDHKIEYKHWIVGQEQAEKWREGLHQIYAQVNSDDTASNITLDDKVISCIESLQNKERRGPTAREIAKYLHMNTIKVEPILQSLARNEVVEKQKDGKAIRYVSLEVNQ